MTDNFAKTVAVAGTAERLSATRLKARWVHIQAKTGNTGQIYHGASTVSSSIGQELSRLEGFMYPPIKDECAYDLHTIWINAGVNGEGANVLYERPE